MRLREDKIITHVYLTSVNNHPIDIIYDELKQVVVGQDFCVGQKCFKVQNIEMDNENNILKIVVTA